MGSRRLYITGTEIPGPPGDPGPPGTPGGIQSITEGANIHVDNTDPAHPVVSSTGGGGGGDPASSIHAAPPKTTLADPDEFGFWNSVGGVLGKITYANLKAQIAAYIATLTQVFTNKDLTSGTNAFPTFNQNTTGLAASATKLATARAIAGHNFDGTAAISIAAADVGAVPTTRNVNGKPLSADVTLGFADLTGRIADAQQIVGNVILVIYDGSNWVTLGGVVLTGRPSAKTDVCVIWLDTTPTGAAPTPAWMLLGKDMFLRATTAASGGGGGGGGGGTITQLLRWYGAGLGNAHVIGIGDAGTGDSPAVASVGGTTPPTILATGGPFGAEAVQFGQGAGQVCNTHYTLSGPNPTGRVRFFFQTPGAWYSGGQTLMKMTDASDNLLLGATLRGSTVPGAVSVNDSTGGNASGTGTTPNNTLAFTTWYRGELALDQTASPMTARLVLYSLTGTTVFDSGLLTTLSLGTLNTFNKIIWGAGVAGVTTSIKQAMARVLLDPATPVGPS